MAPSSCEVFAHMIFKISSGRPTGAKEIKEMDDVSALWRAITIDALGPVGIQTKAILQLLRKEHDAFVDDRLAVKQSMPSSFQSNFPGGDYLKALLVVSELDELTKTSKGHTDAKRIMKEVEKFLNGRNPANNWRVDFEENIEERYVPRGKELINGGYKWLIHAQQPYSAPLKRVVKRIATRPTFNRIQSPWD
jgi:hypothetical protein